jgi:cytochrome c oxidase assembly factor CtaG
MPLLHSGHPVTWSAWHFEPTVIGIAVIVVGLYIYGLKFAGQVEWWRPACFFGGSLVIFLALASPLDAASDYLLSMHMLQHVVLTTFGPPLVLLGLPPQTLRRLLPAGSARYRAVAVLTLPFVAGALVLVNMWVWHVPPVYETALTDIPVHIAMHVAFMGMGLLFWWPIINPVPEMATYGNGTRLLYLFVTGFPMGILALLLLASQTVIYDPYLAQTQRLWGVSALTDQQMAGVIMGSLGESATFLAFSLIFMTFLMADEPEPEPAPPQRMSADRAL